MPNPLNGNRRGLQGNRRRSEGDDGTVRGCKRSSHVLLHRSHAPSAAEVPAPRQHIQLALAEAPKDLSNGAHVQHMSEGHGIPHVGIAEYGTYNGAPTTLIVVPYPEMSVACIGSLPSNSHAAARGAPGSGHVAPSAARSATLEASKAVE